MFRCILSPCELHACSSAVPGVCWWAVNIVPPFSSLTVKPVRVRTLATFVGGLINLLCFLCECVYVPKPLSISLLIIWAELYPADLHCAPTFQVSLRRSLTPPPPPPTRLHRLFCSIFSPLCFCLSASLSQGWGQTHLFLKTLLSSAVERTVLIIQRDLRCFLHAAWVSV